MYADDILPPRPTALTLPDRRLGKASRCRSRWETSSQILTWLELESLTKPSEAALARRVAADSTTSTARSHNNARGFCERLLDNRGFGPVDSCTRARQATPNFSVIGEMLKMQIEIAEKVDCRGIRWASPDAPVSCRRPARTHGRLTLTRSGTGYRFPGGYIQCIEILSTTSSGNYSHPYAILASHMDQPSHLP